MSRPPEDNKRSGSPRRPSSGRGAAGRSTASATPRWNDQNVGEVYFEFRPVGPYMRVNVIHAATGFETFAMGPRSVSSEHLKGLALRKLITGLNNRG